jgi:hypothetical protein
MFGAKERVYHAVTRDNIVAEVLRRVTGQGEIHVTLISEEMLTCSPDANALIAQLCAELDGECEVSAFFHSPLFFLLFQLLFQGGLGLAKGMRVGNCVILPLVACVTSICFVSL